MAPLEELDDSTKGLEGWRRAGLLWNCSIPITNTKGLYLYPCPNTTPGRLRVQHSLPKLMSRRQCPSRTRHQFVTSFYPGHVITYPRMLPFSSANSPSAEWWRTTDRKYIYRTLWGEFPAEWCFFTKLDPQVIPFPVPIFGVNRWLSAYRYHRINRMSRVFFLSSHLRFRIYSIAIFACLFPRVVSC
jgi:hypothetical protein